MPNVNWFVIFPKRYYKKLLYFISMTVCVLVCMYLIQRIDVPIITQINEEKNRSIFENLSKKSVYTVI